MRDLYRFVARKYASDWKQICIELGLDHNSIKSEYPFKNEDCLMETLDKWLKSSTDDATWKTLEVVLTNVNRAKLGLDPVDDVYGKDV